MLNDSSLHRHLSHIVICARCNIVILIFSPHVIYFYVIHIPFFVSQRADFSVVTLSKNADRNAVIDFTQPVESLGFTFLVKKTPNTKKLSSLYELAHVEDMHTGMIRGGYLESVFKNSSDPTEKLIWRVIQVSGTVLSNGMGKRSKPLYLVRIYIVTCSGTF